MEGGIYPTNGLYNEKFYRNKGEKLDTQIRSSK